MGARVEDVETLLQSEWTYDALQSHLLRMRLGFSAGDLHDAVKSMEVNSRVLIPCEAVQEALLVQEALQALRDLAGLRAARKAQEPADELDKARRVWQCRN